MCVRTFFSLLYNLLQVKWNDEIIFMRTWRCFRPNPNARAQPSPFCLKRGLFYTASFFHLFYLQYLHLLDSHCDEHIMALKETDRNTELWEHKSPQHCDVPYCFSLCIKGNFSEITSIRWSNTSYCLKNTFERHWNETPWEISKGETYITFIFFFFYFLQCGSY